MTLSIAVSRSHVLEPDGVTPVVVIDMRDTGAWVRLAISPERAVDLAWELQRAVYAPLDQAAPRC